jgi:hypothetical protein
MTDPRIDPELLAALIDGRLDERARAEVLRALDEDAELRAMYADAVAIEGELAAADAGRGSKVRPFRRGAAPGSWRRGRVMLLAASLAGIAFLPWAVMRSRGDAGAPYALVRQLGVEAEVPALEDPWTVTRGGPAPMSERGRAVRLGARLVDLELAIAARDSGMLGAVATSVATLANTDPPLTGAPVDLYRRIAAGDAAAVRDRGARREGWEAMSELAGEEATRLGAWLEAARVAVVRRDAEFFRSRVTRRVLDDGAMATDADERAAMEQVRSAAGNGSPDWAALATALEAALKSAGR